MDKRYLVTSDCEVKAVDLEARTVHHVVSRITPDRIGDVVVPTGADLENFKKNPVVLVDHRYSAKEIIGNGEVTTFKDRIEARTTFATTPLAEDMWNLVRNGFARAWSIGFQPREFEAIEEKGPKGRSVVTGYKHKVWELLEYSLVAIGMHPDALTEYRHLKAYLEGARDYDAAYVKFRRDDAELRKEPIPPASNEVSARAKAVSAEAVVAAERAVSRATGRLKLRSAAEEIAAQRARLRR